MDIPENVQVDKDIVFYGGQTHPRGMGPLTRLFLLLGVNLWFILIADPWRDGVIEKFSGHYCQKILAKVAIGSEKELMKTCFAYEHEHNNPYRYSKLQGQTPLKALAHSGRKLLFPNHRKAPRHSLEKPVSGYYPLVIFIRSDLRVNIFGELFPVPQQVGYEYVAATFDIKEQKLKLFLDKIQIEKYKYRMP